MVSSGASRRRTRLAPSPTGALHLGNARTFLINFALATQNAWEVLLRIDDLEGPRVRPHADQQAMEDLAWLGLDWTPPPVYQSRRSHLYHEALEHLERRGLTFPCICTRQQLMSSARGFASDGAPIYAGTCRGRFASPEAALNETGREPAIRFRVPDGAIVLDDGFTGRCEVEGATQLGDFIVRKASGEYGYQLATVVDEAEMGITDVVRGQDLLASTSRQLLLFDALELSDRMPAFHHLPLIVGADGRKLAKRHGDTRLCQLREEGITPGRVRRLLADWSGFAAGDGEIGIDEWVERFDLSKLPRRPIVYDDARNRPTSAVDPRGTGSVADGGGTCPS